MGWTDEKAGWFKIQEGDTKEFTVLKITEKKSTTKIKALPNKDYYYEFETSLGTLTINNLGLFNTLVSAMVREGDRIRIKYVKRGTIGNPSQFEIDVISKVFDEDISQETPF
jgi:hypothetical protein